MAGRLRLPCSLALLFALLCLHSAAAPTAALAHPPPEVWQIVSTRPDDTILATTRGLLFGNLETRAWTLLCTDGFGVSTSLQYRVAELPAGRLLMAASDGLQGSDDRGCTWRAMPALGGASTPFMVQDPNAPDHVYIASYVVGDGGVLLTTDGADSVSKLLAVSDDDYIGSLLLAPGSTPSEPVHLYAGITYFPPNVDFSYFVQHSADGGKTWDRNQVALTSDEVDLTLLAVNPRQPLQLVARASAMEPINGERLLFSRDGGKTFSSPLTVRAMRAAAFSDDGKLLYVGGRDGLVRAQIVDGAALSFTPVTSSTRISAIAQLDQQLLGCGYYQGDEVGVNGVGISALPADGSPPSNFTSWMDFYEVVSPISCPTSSPVNQKCAQLWLDYQVENPPPLVNADAGAGDAGSATPTRDAGAVPDAAPAAPDAGRGANVAPHAHSGGGCALASPRRDGPGSGLLFGAWAWLALACASTRRTTPRVAGTRESRA